MLCGMTSGSGPAQPRAVSIPEESSKPKDASQLHWEPRSQHLSYPTSSLHEGICNASAHSWQPGSPCSCSDLLAFFFLPGELTVICKHGQIPGGSLDSTAKMFRPQLRCSSTWKPCLSGCAVEGALGLGLQFQSLPSGVEICMLIPACRSRQTHLLHFVHITLIVFHVHHRKSN